MSHKFRNEAVGFGLCGTTVPICVPSYPGLSMFRFIECLALLVGVAVDGIECMMITAAFFEPPLSMSQQKGYEQP